MNKSIDNRYVWIEHSKIIQEYFQLLPSYQALCSEVSYIIEKFLKSKGIKFSSITHRTKTIESFLNKVQRKDYDVPFAQMSDIAGVRVNCLYREDTGRIQTLLPQAFEVIESVNKLDIEEDRFGYAAHHYVIRLHMSYQGPRYDDLRNLVCELQVRTLIFPRFLGHSVKLGCHSLQLK